ncbi:hypothetical protein O0I10_004010 [Lichtheimia ornata]|uniref:Fanconi anemia group i protein n=1 Tax=Lichtheimia ornata TaxID=688661 RepID=A0AAD7V7Z7_9FUNG|nr:uncharacterized protein O0I10_004010 [Lichtheimia ornata]KAJ8660151.1 hypothetical protein O0I10_004010 [Lichtheimia ornata]
MDVQILKLAKQTNRQGLVDFLDSKSLDEISQLIRSQLTQSSTSEDVDPLLIVRAIFIGSPFASSKNGHAHMERRVLTFKTAFLWLVNDASTDNRTASNLVNLLLPELETLTVDTLEELASIVTQAIGDQRPLHQRAFEILSKVWNILSTLERPLYDVLDNLLRAKWISQSAIALASAFNEMELQLPELDKVVKRMSNQLNDLEVDETPPFIYQLLLLSRKGHKREIISSICNHFNTKYSNNPSDAVARMEGTVMLHISFAIKQEQELGNEFVKHVRGDKKHLLETFPLACLLSAARIHRLEDPIFDLLRSHILAIYKDGHRLKKCAWIAEFSNVEEDMVKSVILDIVEKSAQGWDQVIQSLVQLAMGLIDNAASQGVWSKAGNVTKAQRNKDGPLENVMALGNDILKRMFELHDLVRSEILDQITSRVVTGAPSTSCFLELLASLITESSHAVEPYLANIKDTLDYLSLLPEATAERFLEVIEPVSKQNEQFRDALMLVLRKSMFAKDLSGRMVAVNGFLNLLTGQMNDNASPAAQGIAFESLGLLRRCFNQQAQVRVAAYQGLGALSKHSTLTGDIFEVLYGQFQKAYQKDTGVSSPLRLEMCVENATNGGLPRLTEPIHVLLANMLKTLRRIDDSECNTVVQELANQCRGSVRSLLFRLTKADLEDYDLDKTAEFDMATHLGMRNHMYATLLMGCYEAAIEHEYLSHGNSNDSFQMILDLFNKRNAVAAMLKETSSGEKGRKATQPSESPVMSLECISKMSRQMFRQNNMQHPVRALRVDISFVQFIITTAQNCLKMGIMQGPTPDFNFEYCVELGRIFLNILVVEDSDSSFINHQPKRGHSVLGGIIDSLRTVHDTVHQLWPHKMTTFIAKLSGSESDQSRNAMVSEVLNTLMDIVAKYLGDRTPLYKEAANVMQLIVTLCHHLDRAASDFETHTRQVIGWLESLAKNRPIEDISLAREVISLLIYLCGEVKDFITYKYLAQDMRKVLGDLDDSTYDDEDSQPMETRITYVMLNPKTCAACTLQLFSSLDQLYDDITWAVGRIKPMDSEDDNTRAFEQAITYRLTSYISVTLELTKSLMSGSHGETLIKVLTKLYKTLTALVKYKLGHPREIGSNFKDVINGVKDVTDNMYRFLILYGQNHQGDPMAIASKKGKGKGKQGANSREKAKILRESKMIPNLIFVVEQFERHLIQLSRKSKVDLMQNMKRSTSRDFRINMQYLTKQENSDEDDDTDSKRRREDQEEEEDAVNKRRR